MSGYSDVPPHDLDELKLALQRSPLLRALMEIAPEIMQDALKEESFPAETVLFREGDASDRAYAIWSGRLRVQHEMGSGAPLVMRDCVPGDVVGEVSLLDNQPRSATVIVVEDSRLISLSRQDLQTLLTQKPEAAVALLQALSYRLRSSDEYLVSASHSVDFLARRVAGDTTAAGDVALQWGGLSRFLRELSTTADGLTGGLKALERVLAPTLTEETKDTFTLVEAQANRLSRTVERARIVEVLESGEAVLDKKPAMIGAMVERIAAQFTPAARPLGVLFDVRVEPGIPMVWADEELLHEALSQLMDNALRFAPPGSAVVVEVARPFKEEMRLSMSDAGPGVPPEYRETIFEPFVRGPDDEGSGFGLGLAICRAIVRAHGGRIWVEDGPEGEGSTFLISLPIGSADD